MTLHHRFRKQLFPSCSLNVGHDGAKSKMRALQDVKQSGLETTLLVDPVDDFAIGGVAGDGFAQELADAEGSNYPLHPPTF